MFAHSSRRETLAAEQLMLHTLPRFGWLVHPTKCQCCFEGMQTFIALGTVVCLATHTYRVSAETLARILRQATSLVEGSRVVPVRKVVQVKSTISATWVATGGCEHGKWIASLTLGQSRRQCPPGAPNAPGGHQSLSLTHAWQNSTSEFFQLVLPRPDLGAVARSIPRFYS